MSAGGRLGANSGEEGVEAECLKRVPVKRSREIGLYLDGGLVVKEGFLYFGWVR